MVVLNISGTKHFELIRNITNTTVYLFDPNLGNIEMSREKFNELYIGVALIINGQAPANATILTDDEMRDIKGMWHYKKIAHTYWIPGYYKISYRWVGFSFSVPYVYFKWVPSYKMFGWLRIPGHYEPRIGWKRIYTGFWLLVIKYVKPRKVTYYTYEPVIPVTVKIKPDRIDPSVNVAIAEGVFILGLVSGISEGIGLASALEIALGGISLELAYRELYDVYHDPWIEVTVDGHKLWLT